MSICLAYDAPETTPQPTLTVVDGEPFGPAPATDALEVNPRLLRCFVTVAEELHFGRAADRLYIAQPALSRSIRQLERLLDRQLFVRTTRSVQPTEHATRLVPAAREVLEALNELAGAVRSSDDRLRVAHVPCSDTAALLLDGFARLMPAAQVQELTMTASEQLAALRDGGIDVALCRAPSTPDSRLRSKIIRLDPLLVVQLGRHASSERPVDPSRRSVAAADGGPEDGDYAEFLAGFEQAAQCSLRRVRVAAGSGTEAYAIRRSGALAFVTLASRGVRLDAAHPVAGTVPIQAYYPWSIVWRRAERSTAVRAFLSAAQEVSAARRWCKVDSLPGEPWILAASGVPERQWMEAA